MFDEVTSFLRKLHKDNSYKGHIRKMAENKLKKNFTTPLPHQNITIDTTEFKYYEAGAQKKLYLNLLLDLFNNEIISYTTSQRPTYQVLEITSECLYRRTFYSDQG